MAVLVSFFSALNRSHCVMTPLADTTLRPIFTDDFSKALDTTNWVSEIAPLPYSAVYTQSGKLIVNTQGGGTVWLNKKLHGNIRIEFDRTVLVDTGRNDRLSDVNVFWMATDPHNQNLFTRNGVLESYDSLQLYYVGMGGNTNKTTRFRKYDGKGNRVLLQEYTDTAHLLQANKTYHFVITVDGAVTTFSVDGTPFFTYRDAQILKEGYFGFRSTKTRQAIDNFAVYAIND